MPQDLLDIGIEFAKEYIKATPEQRKQFASRIKEMACSSDELLQAANTLGEIAKNIKEK